MTTDTCSSFAVDSKHANTDITVLVVDDVAVMRAALTDLLDGVDGVRVVGQAADGDEAIERVRELSPDVIVMDMRMPRMSGIESTREITRAGPRPRVLMLSAYGDESLVRQAIQAGAWSFMLKDAPPNEIAEAVIATAAGKKCFSAEVHALSLDRSTSCRAIDEEGKHA